MSLLALMQSLNGMSNRKDAYILEMVLQELYKTHRSQMLSTAGLVISTTTTKAKTGAANAYYMAGGVVGMITAGTDMPVLVGTVTNAKFNVFVFTVDSAGNTYTQMGVEGAAIGSVKFPPIPSDQAVIGFVIINPTGTGNFVGGTTPLGDATVVPNAVYVSLTGQFSANVIV